MIYLDTSAMVKLVVREEDSEALIDWLNEQADDDPTHALKTGNRPSRNDCCTSTIGRIELMRAAHRLGDTATVISRGIDAVIGDETDAVAAARQLLDKLDTLVMTDEIADTAAYLVPTELRTLDAIHLATILMHQTVITTVCVYDQRLAAACKSEGLAVVAPTR